jgi:hypothetical protein
MGEDKAERRAAATVGVCPVCGKGPVNETTDLTAFCANHEPYLFLDREDAGEPWRISQPEP